MSDHHHHGGTGGGPLQSPHETAPARRSFWGSRVGWATIGFLLIAAFLLLSEHRAHALGFLPFLLILACPLLHMFGHGGHGGHGGHADSQAPAPSSRSREG